MVDVKLDTSSAIWNALNSIRGRFESNSFKNYFFSLFFYKFISYKYTGVKDAPILIPKDAKFDELLALRGTPEIGENINKKLAAISSSNELFDFPDFNKEESFGKGVEKIRNLSNLIALFSNDVFDFTKYGKDGDEKIQDLFDDLLDHFVRQESGYSICTPDLSELLAKILGIAKSSKSQLSIYDPFCGSASLLLRVANESKVPVQLFGQEINAQTAMIAQMSSIIHNQISARITNDNTFSSPSFVSIGELEKFDYVVSVPPFSYKSWTQGFDAQRDVYSRFLEGLPPEHNGDYACLLHILHSMKSKGKAMCVLPVGALFRGGSEAIIRKNIVDGGFIEGIISLPPSLFYHTSIPVCILLLDKEYASSRKEIFMIDASSDFESERFNFHLGVNRIQKIVECYSKKTEVPFYSRSVNIEEIEGNEYNLNISRYITSKKEREINNLQTEYKSYKEYFLGDIAKKINSTTKTLTTEKNAIYISKIGKFAPVTNVEAIDPKHHHFYFQVVLDLEVVEATYLEIFFKSKIGSSILDVKGLENANMASLIPRLTASAVSELRVYIPDLNTQKIIIETANKLYKLRRELEKFEAQLSLNPNSAKKIQNQLTSALDSIGALNEEDHILELISQGESLKLEFKQTFSKDVDTNIKEKEKIIRESSLKNIVAFLNAEGGTLLIGVSDKGEIIGIEQDYYINDDKYCLNFSEHFNTHIGEDKCALVNWKIVTVLNRKLLMVTCKKSSKAVFLDKKFMVKENPSVRQLEGEKMLEYIREHFRETI